MPIRAFTGKVRASSDDLRRLEETHRAFNECALLAQRIGVFGRRPEFWRDGVRMQRELGCACQALDANDALTTAEAIGALCGKSTGKPHELLEKLRAGSKTKEETKSRLQADIADLRAILADAQQENWPVRLRALAHDNEEQKERHARLADTIQKRLERARELAAKLAVRTTKPARRRGQKKPLTADDVLAGARKRNRETIEKLLKKALATLGLSAVAQRPLPRGAFGRMPSDFTRNALSKGIQVLRSHIENRDRWRREEQERRTKLAELEQSSDMARYKVEVDAIESYRSELVKARLRRRAREASYAKWLATQVPTACSRHGIQAPEAGALREAVSRGARGGVRSVLELCAPLREADELHYRRRELSRPTRQHALTWIDANAHPAYSSWLGFSNGVRDAAIMSRAERLVKIILAGPRGDSYPREERYTLELVARVDQRLLDHPTFLRWVQRQCRDEESVTIELHYPRRLNGCCDYARPYLRFTVNCPDTPLRDGKEAGLDLGQRRHVLVIRWQEGGAVKWRPIFFVPRPGDAQMRDAGYSPLARRRFQSECRREQSRHHGSPVSPSSGKTLTKARDYQAKRLAAEIVETCLREGVGTLYIENLQPGAMHSAFRTRKQNQAFKEWCVTQTMSFLELRCKREGVALKLKPAPYTSQVCSLCGDGRLFRYRIAFDAGTKAKAPVHDASGPACICTKCGKEPNPDVNAAKNLIRLGRGEFPTIGSTSKANRERIVAAGLARLAEKNPGVRGAGQAFEVPI